MFLFLFLFAFMLLPLSHSQDLKCYFLLTKRFKSSHFDAIRASLPQLSEMGINTLWLSPVHPQTTQGWADNPNNHNYWPSSHSEIGEDLGGKKAFLQLIKTARAQGIEICLDVVLNHFGYGHTFVLGGLEVSSGQHAYFRPKAPPDVMQKIYERLRNSNDPQEIRRQQKNLAQYALFRLPTLRHQNPTILKYLTEAYKPFIDLGIRTFRIDAAKHIPLEVTIAFINALNQYAKEKGYVLRFIWELFLEKYPALDVLANDALQGVDNKNEQLFFDFPLAAELTRLQDPNYQLTWLRNFIEYRENGKHPLQHYIPMVEDHDFFPRIKDHFFANAIYALAEFLSLNSVVLFHGSEQSGALKEQRQWIEGLAPEGNIALLTKKMQEVLRPYRGAFLPTVIHFSDEHTMLIEKRLSDRSVFLFLNKSSSSTKRAVFVGRTIKTIEMHHHYCGSGSSTLRKLSDDSIEVQSTGQCLLVFEAT